MQIRIDHVTVAGAALTPLKEAFASVGLKTDFGGAHSNEITHMAYLPFDDGSYLELISTRQPRAQSPIWNRHILNDAGLCAWAIEPENIAEEARRLSALGLIVDGPTHMSRRWPDGALAEWDLVAVGEGEPGTLLPFLIKDRTPREMRVRMRPRPAGERGRQAVDRLVGIATVILGVRNLEKSIELYQQVYGLKEPEIVENMLFGATLARFPESPVVLATPLKQPPPKIRRYDEDEQDWLDARLHRFGDVPVGCLIGVSDIELVIERFEMDEDPEPWFTRQAAWFDEGKLNGIRLGIVSL